MKNSILIFIASLSIILSKDIKAQPIRLNQSMSTDSSYMSTFATLVIADFIMKGENAILKNDLLLLYDGIIANAKQKKITNQQVNKLTNEGGNVEFIFVQVQIDTTFFNSIGKLKFNDPTLFGHLFRVLSKKEYSFVIQLKYHSESFLYRIGGFSVDDIDYIKPELEFYNRTAIKHDKVLKSILKKSDLQLLFRVCP